MKLDVADLESDSVHPTTASSSAIIVFYPLQCKTKGRSVRPKLRIEKSKNRGDKSVVSNAAKEFVAYPPRARLLYRLE
ncbi:hypothetical protein BVRB_7g168960 [Beta vulgaris subsp. vulgaris]|nr:hypothetical protein BVRB_7g168960 [Beta vulgaris subsp. vulgaris]